MSKNGRLPMVQAGMTDEDVIRRAQLIAGVGVVHGPYKKKRSDGGFYKDLWVFFCGNQFHAYALMVALLPWMGSRRRQDILVALDNWKQWRIVDRPVQVRAGAESRRVLTEGMQTRILSEYDGIGWKHGQKTRLARELGVNRSVIYKFTNGGNVGDKQQRGADS